MKIQLIVYEIFACNSRRIFPRFPSIPLGDKVDCIKFMMISHNNVVPLSKIWKATKRKEGTQ